MFAKCYFWESQQCQLFPAFKLMESESLPNYLLMCRFWIGLVCTDSFIEILVRRAEDRKNTSLWETVYYFNNT